MSNEQFSIKDLENFTQIKAHTIRIWEQRYGLLVPKRTETNIRYYNESDLKKILNIHLLYKSGVKISHIAKLSEDELIAKAKSLIASKDSENSSLVNDVVMNIIDFNGDKISQIFEEVYQKNAMIGLYNTLINQILVKLGDLWQVNSIEVIHEHFFSNLYREYIIVKTNSIDVEIKPNKKAFLFLHEEEEHELSLLLSNYFLRKNGFKCFYFGQKVPLKNIDKAIDKIKPNLVLTSFTAKISDKKYRKIENQLVKLTSNSNVIISGSQLRYFETGVSKELIKINSIDELLSEIKK